MEVFDGLAVADQVLARGTPLRGIIIRRGGREITRMESRHDPHSHPSPRPDQPYHCVVIVKKAIVEGLLRGKLAGLSGQVERERELRTFEETPSGVVAQMADLASDTVERVSAKWLVGCDGARSTVRGLLQLPFEGTEYPEARNIPSTWSWQTFT
jgi:2-polyprenyl-6-methoxyphenol hydroxylase-like FAD-dependent oxidoreductase